MPSLLNLSQGLHNPIYTTMLRDKLPAPSITFVLKNYTDPQTATPSTHLPRPDLPAPNPRIRPAALTPLITPNPGLHPNALILLSRHVRHEPPPHRRLVARLARAESPRAVGCAGARGGVADVVCVVRRGTLRGALERGKVGWAGGGVGFGYGGGGGGGGVGEEEEGEEEEGEGGEGGAGGGGEHGGFFVVGDGVEGGRVEGGGSVGGFSLPKDKEGLEK